MDYEHIAQQQPLGGVELGRGADGVVVEVQKHPEIVIKTMNHPFKLGVNRVKLEIHYFDEVLKATQGKQATQVLNHGITPDQYSWLVRERVFDVMPRGSQASRNELIDIILQIYPNADVNRLMFPDPTYDNVRWGYTKNNREPRWILIDP